MGNMGESTCVRKIPTDCGIAAVCLERERGTKGTEAGVQGLLLLLLFVLRIRCKCSKMLASAVSWAGYEVLVLFLFVFCCKVAILQN